MPFITLTSNSLNVVKLVTFCFYDSFFLYQVNLPLIHSLIMLRFYQRRKAEQMLVSFPWFTSFQNNELGPGWCGSGDWSLACELKGCWFDFLSGNMPGLWAHLCERQQIDVSLAHQYSSLSFSLPPLSLKINKIFLKNNELVSFQNNDLGLLASFKVRLF